MKNTLLMIKQLLQVTYKNILIFEGIILGGYVFGFIISLIIYNSSDDHLFVNLGTFMAMMFLLIEVFFGAIFTCSADFVLAITNGKGRANFVIARYALYVIEFGVGLALIKLGNAIDTAFAKAGDKAIDFLSVPEWPTFLVIALVVPALVMCASALYVRFERKAFWVLWAIWMVVMVAGPRITSAMHKEPESAAAKIGFFFQNAISVGSAQFFIVAAVVGVCIFALNFVLYRYLEAKL